MTEMYAVADLFVPIIGLVILVLVMDGLIRLGISLIQTVSEALEGLF